MTFNRLPLPENASKRLRASLLLIQFLHGFGSAGVDGVMAFVGIWWGGWTIAFPNFWYDWPVTAQLSQMMFGHPSFVSWILLIAGLSTYLAKRHTLGKLQFSCSLLGFVSWALLTVAFASVRPVFSPAVACYSAFAIAALISFLNHGIGLMEIDGYADDDDNDAIRNGSNQAH